MSLTRCMLAGALCAAAALPGAAGAQGVDETCLLALTKLDPGTTNVLFPDDSARYYIAPFVALPGTEIRIAGRFPHARYMSFNVYDALLRPVDALADIELAPDPGSTNPFLLGADRTAAARSYAARISFAPAPATRARNTMYTAAASMPNPLSVFAYRIYIPDRGRDEYGGVALPTAELVSADNGAPLSRSACDTARKPELGQLNELFVGARSTPATEPQASATGRNPPHWRKFVNVLSSVGQAFTDNPALNNLGQPQLDRLGGSGGFLSNRDNTYVAALTHRGFGQVLVTRFRAPTFPDTRGGARRMPGGQLRYWSLCQNDPVSERVVACVNDDRAVVGEDGLATVVVSAPNERPANATRACGVNWLPWGPSARGVLIYRHMLPSGSFAQAIQLARPDHETATMGDYFPVSRYYASAARYAALGCAAAAHAPQSAAPPATARSRCTTRHLLRIRLPRTAVGARAGRHRLRIRQHSAVIDLRWARVVRVTIRLRSGRLVVRRYDRCGLRAAAPSRPR